MAFYIKSTADEAYRVYHDAAGGRAIPERRQALLADTEGQEPALPAGGGCSVLPHPAQDDVRSQQVSFPHSGRPCHNKCPKIAGNHGLKKDQLILVC